MEKYCYDFKNTRSTKINKLGKEFKALHIDYKQLIY